LIINKCRRYLDQCYIFKDIINGSAGRGEPKSDHATAKSKI